MRQTKDQQIQTLRAGLLHALEREATTRAELDLSRACTLRAEQTARRESDRRLEQVKISAAVDEDFMKMAGARVHDRAEIRRLERQLAILATAEIDRSITRGEEASHPLIVCRLPAPGVYAPE